MIIPSQTVVMVVDGGKMLLFRNMGDATHPNLQVEEAIANLNPPDREQTTDRPGRAFSSGAGGTDRSAMERTDHHQLAEDRFAADTADALNRQAEAGDFAKLIIVAPPKTLGEMRRHYSKAVKERLIGEIGKTLTAHPVAEIQQIIQRAE